MTDVAERIRRNHLLAYVRRRVEEAVLVPLRTDTTTLDAAEQVLSAQRNHFRGLGIGVGPLFVRDGQFIVDIEEGLHD
jgi:hypothetical protein